MVPVYFCVPYVALVCAGDECESSEAPEPGMGCSGEGQVVGPLDG